MGRAKIQIAHDILFDFLNLPTSIKYIETIYNFNKGVFEIIVSHDNIKGMTEFGDIPDAELIYERKKIINIQFKEMLICGEKIDIDNEVM